MALTTTCWPDIPLTILVASSTKHPVEVPSKRMSLFAFVNISGYINWLAHELVEAVAEEFGLQTSQCAFRHAFGDRTFFNMSLRFAPSVSGHFPVSFAAWCAKYFIVRMLRVSRECTAVRSSPMNEYNATSKVTFEKVVINL